VVLNPNCALIVPPNPLTAVGLSTPYQLVPAVVGAGPCNQSNPNQASFVQGAVLDLINGIITVYNPLVVDAGTQPLVAPIVPTLPASFIIGIWFGSNAGTLTLLDSGGSLVAGNCVNGLSAADVFGQFAYCNAPAFFAAANALIQAGKLSVPLKGTGFDGLPCPTVRDFSVVDMDQSDNVVTTYLVVGAQTAQVTAANLKNFAGALTEVNGSDNRLLSVALDGALGCTPWMAPDLANPGYSLPALPLNELQAAFTQGLNNPIPPAIIPSFDPMTLSAGVPNLKKLNLYRQGVFQPNATSLTDPGCNTTLYCQHIVAVAFKRIFIDRQFTIGRPSPDPNAANSLFGFLANRLSGTIGAGGLNCLGLLKLVNPITLTLNAGIVTDATFNFAAIGQTPPIVVPTTIPTSATQNVPVGVPSVGSNTVPNVVGAATSISMEIMGIFLALVLVLY